VTNRPSGSTAVPLARGPAGNDPAGDAMGVSTPIGGAETPRADA
jgi:hypothetical protein